MAGNEKGLEHVVEEHRRWLLGLAWRLTGNTADAEDVAQEAFLRWHRSAVPTEEAGPWLRRVVVNLCIDRSRRSVREVAMPPREFTAAVETPETQAGRAQQHERLRIAMQKLSERERTALVLRDIEGLSTGEVAEAMGTAEATVRVQIAKARLKLREMLR